MVAPRRANTRVALIAALALFLYGGISWAQCVRSVDPTLQHLSSQHDWNAAVDAARSLKNRTAADDYVYGMALAHLQRWREAESALRAGQARCPADERFAVELGGVAFQQKDYPAAASSLRRALRMAPDDRYALDFAGTVYFLMGNTDAALKYWNRVQKPSVAQLQLDPQIALHRLLLERAFAFGPASTLEREQYVATETRLRSLEIFPAFNIALSARPDGKFDASYHAVELNGFGSTRVQALLSTFGGAVYETIYPNYYNLGKSGVNVHSLLRWDAQKRRAFISASGPLQELPQWRWQLSADGRNENWSLRPSFTGHAPEDGFLNLQRQVVTAAIAGLPHGSLRWSTGVEMSHRTFRGVRSGSGLTPELLAAGTAVKHLASVSGTVLDVPEHRFRIDGAADSEFARLWSTPARLYEKVQGSGTARWYPQATGDLYEVRQQIRAGDTFGRSPFDELYMLGVERDNPLWLRGLIGTRDGRKGSSPLGSRYVLSNSDFERRVYSNGVISIKVGPWLDIGRAHAPTAALAPREWLFSEGAEARISVLGTGVVLTWGRDLRAGTNAFYGTLASQ